MDMINLSHATRQAEHLEEIYTQLRKKNVTFPKNTAYRIVGSRPATEELIASGRIRCSQRTDGKFNRFDCNAEDVIRHANYLRK